MNGKDSIVLVLFLAVLMTVLGLAIKRAGAHQSDDGREDYSRYLTNEGISCCDMRDCAPTTHSFGYHGEVVMRPYGKTVVIPQDKINKLRSTDGRAHHCGWLDTKGEVVTRCAILPPEGS